MEISGGVVISGGVQLVPPGGGGGSVATDSNFSNVSLLLNGDGTNGAQNNTFVDGSSNGYTVTENGSVIQGSFSPYSLPSGRAYTGTDGGSIYIGNNSSNYLTVSAGSFSTTATNYTIEAWAYWESAGTGVIINGITSGNSDRLYLSHVSGTYYFGDGDTNNIIANVGAPTTNTWIHYAIVKNGSTTKLYIDGVEEASTTTALGTYTIAEWQVGARPSISATFPGYLSDVRVVNGTAVYTSAFTPTTSPLTAVTNTSLLIRGQNSGIFDLTGKNNIDTVGNAQISTSVKKFGTGSVKFDGTDDRLTCASSTDFEVGTGDFTIEGWAYNAGDKHSGLFQISGTSGGLQPNNTLNIAVGMRKGPVRWQMYTNGAYNDAASATWSPNTWYHFAMVRSSGVAKLYVDGTEVISVTDTNNYTGTNIVVGGYYSTSYLFDGYIDDFRVTKGVARYTSNFTAPTAALPAVTAGSSPSPAPSYSFQGSSFGYNSGGYTGSVYSNVIEKYSFTSDANATDVGDLTVARNSLAGQSSSASGYSSGGEHPGSKTTIDKFPFASDGNATDVGDLATEIYASAGQSSSASGYTSGNRVGPSVGTTIEKFSFSADGNATDVGDLTAARGGPAGQSSSASGYTSGGGYYGSTYLNTIDKFPFASDGNASDVGDLTGTAWYTTGQSSTASGYRTGGYSSGVTSVNIIDKFPFSSNGNATDVGDLSTTKAAASGTSSTASGYVAAGATPARVNVIEKFSFTSDGNTTDVGDLTTLVSAPVGQQN